ncbi:atherin-like [Motacilla alba alba]|uniref:atherin-like n=1 Tax=Motacilla alba alba TaxID=1094192 RepID=UPI0018D4EBEA|nr:atherin-like [Motacilla alba alba]
MASFCSPYSRSPPSFCCVTGTRRVPCGARSEGARGRERRLWCPAPSALPEGPVAGAQALVPRSLSAAGGARGRSAGSGAPLPQRSRGRAPTRALPPLPQSAPGGAEPAVLSVALPEVMACALRRGAPDPRPGSPVRPFRGAAAEDG